MESPETGCCHPRKPNEKRTEPWGPSAFRVWREEIRKTGFDVVPTLKKLTVSWGSRLTG